MAPFHVPYSSAVLLSLSPSSSLWTSRLHSYTFFISIPQLHVLLHISLFDAPLVSLHSCYLDCFALLWSFVFFIATPIHSAVALLLYPGAALSYSSCRCLESLKPSYTAPNHSGPVPCMPWYCTCLIPRFTRVVVQVGDIPVSSSSSLHRSPITWFSCCSLSFAADSTTSCSLVLVISIGCSLMGT